MQQYIKLRMDFCYMFYDEILKLRRAKQGNKKILFVNNIVRFFVGYSDATPTGQIWKAICKEHRNLPENYKIKNPEMGNS